ncbi:hypothetical protein [Leptolyngbya sp. FACHB-261]|uniref:hypothetical protein n=1 Tax=Leptolyngbya sp. FACHB-261 TaxID=2692806 RepID=UPI001688B20B|nr:hypothetical protein [Leptolyngbya sp. FACHB-261]MBD2100806.1 hypothetical protein [Leptolyngbya sp. FACHB-261]
MAPISRSPQPIESVYYPDGLGNEPEELQQLRAKLDQVGVTFTIQWMDVVEGKLQETQQTVNFEDLTLEHQAEAMTFVAELADKWDQPTVEHSEPQVETYFVERPC